MASLDQNAWNFPDGGYIGTSSTPTVGIGMRLSQISLASSILTMEIDYGPFTFAGTPGGKPSAQKLLAGGTIMWKTMQMLYGTIEVRAKMPDVTIHNTIWLLGSQLQQTFYQTPNDNGGGGFAVREIDIAEMCPAADGTTTLRQNVFLDNGTDDLFTTTITDPATNWHTYKIVWTPTSITWFVDGVQTNTSSKSPNLQMFLLIDLEADDFCSGTTGPSGDFPQYVEVDYVRAWNQNGEIIFNDDFDGNPAFQNISQTNLTFMQASDAKGTSSPLTIALPQNTLGQSYLIAAVIQQSGSSLGLADSLGNVWEPIGALFQGAYQLYHVPVNNKDGGANTVTVSAPGAIFISCAVAEYVGQLQSSPVDAIPVWSTAASGAATTNPTLANFTNEDFIVWGISFQSGPPDINTPGPGFVVEYSFDDTNRWFLEDTLPAPVTPGPQIGTWTPSVTSLGWTTVGVTLKSIASQAPYSQIVVGDENQVATVLRRRRRAFL